MLYGRPGLRIRLGIRQTAVPPTCCFCPTWKRCTSKSSAHSSISKRSSGVSACSSSRSHCASTCPYDYCSRSRTARPFVASSPCMRTSCVLPCRWDHQRLGGPSARTSRWVAMASSGYRRARTGSRSFGLTTPPGAIADRFIGVTDTAVSRRLRRRPARQCSAAISVGPIVSRHSEADAVAGTDSDAISSVPTIFRSHSAAPPPRECIVARVYRCHRYSAFGNGQKASR